MGDYIEATNQLLEENSQNLQNKMQQYKNDYDNLETEINKLLDDTPTEKKLNEEELDIEYENLNRIVCEKEKENSKWESKMADINGSLSRISTQLRISEVNKTEVDTNNCGEILTKIGLKLEKLLSLLVPRIEDDNDQSIKKIDCN